MEASRSISKLRQKGVDYPNLVAENEKRSKACSSSWIDSRLVDIEDLEDEGKDQPDQPEH